MSTTTQPPVKQPEPKPETKPAEGLDAAFAEMQKKFAGKDINPYDLDDPLAQQKYLIAKGWRPLGNPRFEFTRWQSPRAVFKETKKEVPVEAMAFQGWDDNVKPPQRIYKMKPVMIKDKYQQQVPVKQTQITFPTRPYLMNEAMEIQVGWDREEQEAKVKTQAVA
jgi:hypothetical protein